MEPEYSLEPVDHDPHLVVEPVDHNPFGTFDSVDTQGRPHLTVVPPAPPRDPMEQAGTGVMEWYQRHGGLSGVTSELGDIAASIPPISWGRNALEAFHKGMLKTGAGEPNAEEAFNVASMGSGAPAGLTRAIPNTLGVFAGPRAMLEAAPGGSLGNFRTALNMSRQGHPQGAIRDQTGWFQGIDKQWRFEIPDKPMKTKVISSHPHEDGASEISTVGDIIDHPKLFQAYPELKDVPVMFDHNTIGTWDHGSWSPSEGVIHIQPNMAQVENGATGKRLDRDQRSILLHELQHWVQDREAFAPGGTAEGAHDRILDILVDKIKKRETGSPEFNTIVRGLDPLGLKYDSVNQKFDLGPHNKAVPPKLYHRLAGEVEARNVELRSHFSNEDIKNIAPWHSEDVKRHQQIVMDPVDWDPFEPMSVNRPGGQQGFIWTDELVDKMRGLAKQGFNQQQIADTLGISLGQVAGKIRRLGDVDLAPSKFHPPKPETEKVGGGISLPKLNLPPIFEDRKSSGNIGGMPAPDKMGFYSAVEHAVEQSKLTSAPAEQWLGTIRNTPGVTPKELDWIGLEDWLKSQGDRKISPKEVKQWVAGHKLELKESVLREGITPKQAAEVAPYRKVDPEQITDHTPIYGGANSEYGSDLVSPGGVPGTYKEHLIQLPSSETQGWKAELTTPTSGVWKVFDPKGELKGTVSAGSDHEAISHFDYTSPHWEEAPNVLAHVRHDDVVLPNGERALRIMEMQSDKAARWKEIKADLEQGKYATPEDPLQPRKMRDELQRELQTIDEMPFNQVGDWTALAMKRMIRKAAEEGYDRIAWEPGQVHDKRYGGGAPTTDSVATEGLSWIRHGDNFTFNYKNQDGLAINRTVRADQLNAVLGEERAKTLLNSGRTGILEENNIPLRYTEENNHSGLRELYDKVLPATVDRIIKKYGGRRDKVEMDRAWAVLDKNGETYNARKIDRNDADQIAAKIGGKVIGTDPYALHSFKITPSMRDAALNKGFTLFSAGLPFQFDQVDHDPFERKK